MAANASGAKARIPAVSVPQVPRAPVPARRPSAAYMAGERSPFFWSWNPALREQQTDVAVAYTRAAARAIDALHNSGWLAGGIDQAIASTVGNGLRLATKPDAEALGWDHKTAQEWARKVERRWEAWADRPIECDLEGQMTIGKATAAALRSFFAYGEITAALPFVYRSGGQYGTKFQMIPPHRLSQRTEQDRIIQGVRVDATGFPVAYRIVEASGIRAGTEREIPARDAFGRPQFVHVFDGWPGQRRGISPLAPALKVVRQFDQLSDATLTAALIQAIFAATVKSAAPTEQVLQAFQDLAEQDGGEPTSGMEALLAARAGWYEATKIDLGAHGKIAHLAPGDDLTFHSSQHPNDTYDPFARFLLREIARTLGITFEMLTGDYTGATYSSVRMATSEIWQIVLYRRVHILSPFLNMIYEAWLEEEIEKGLVPFPGGVDGFLNNRAAATRAHWRGPAKPQADDLKFAKAVETLRNLGVITDEWICAELGDDWEDVYDQRRREVDARAERGLPERTPVATSAVDPLIDEGGNRGNA